MRDAPYRILPLYFLVVSLSWFVLYSSTRGWLPAVWGKPFQTQLSWWTFLTFTQNLGFAVVGDFSGVLSITWSLAVEEQFYFLYCVLS